MIREGLTLKRATARYRVSERTAAKWLGRFRREGTAGLQYRSSRPHRHPKTTSEAQVAVVLALRHMRLPRFQIAKYSDLSRATVSRILTRHSLAKLSDLDPPPPAIRYQREHTGDLLHIDIKKLGRIVRPGHRVTGNKRDHFPGAGWEFVHVAIDDASRMAYAKIMPDEKIGRVTEFLREALAHFASFGIRVRQLMSDNGPAYRSQPVAAFLQKLGIEYIFIRPYTHAPTARLNVLSKPACASGLTPPSTKTQPTASNTSNPGSTVTTGTDLTLPLNSKRPSNPSTFP